MSDEAALLQAITANPDEDTPRLVYADWLDEHDAPIQAEFIRLQCRLAAGSAADPDYPDLLERYAEVGARFHPMVRLTAPKLPDGFTHTSAGEHGSAFRRGFLHAAAGEWGETPYYNRSAPTEEQLDRVCTGMADLVATTTVRQLELHTMAPDQLARVLVAPGAGALTGLVVQGIDYYPHTGEALVRALARSKVAANLEHLELHLSTSVAGLNALADANMSRLRFLDFPIMEGAAAEVAAFARAEWFRRLRHVTTGHLPRPLQEPLVVALAGLPHLESLTLRFDWPTALKALGAKDGFPALARLKVTWIYRPTTATRFARGPFPRLAELGVRGLRDESFLPWLTAKWFPQVRVLDASNGFLTDTSAVALSKSAAAPALRILRVGSNRFAKSGLMALADGDRFPNLTTLDARASITQVRAATVARFAAELSLPRVRHLHLDGWPFGDAGAKALAANPALSNVTRLSLNGCGIGDRGFTALVRSPHLQHLVELDFGNNNLKKAAALLDPDLLPRLAAARLNANPLTPAAREKLHRARGWIV